MPDFREFLAILGELARRAVCLVVGHQPTEHPHKWFDPASDWCGRCEMAMPYAVMSSPHAEERAAFAAAYGRF